MRKIVLLGYLPGFGGAERSLCMLANELSRIGHDVTLISIKDNKVVYNINKEVNYKFIQDRGEKKVTIHLNRFISLKKILVDIKPDIVISFWLQPAIFSAILSKFIGFKTIYSERGDPTDKEYKGKLGILRNIFFNMINGFVFQTNGARQCFSQNIQQKSIVIHNPVYIDYNRYDIPTDRRKVIVNVGRLHEQKNQKLLINSFNKIKDRFPEYKLEIYGEGKLENELKEYITQLNLDKRVILKGTTKNLFDKIIDASIFVLSSDYEGMPNALMEAMSLGLPCISTDCSPGGARELINHKENGILCEVGNEEDLSRCIEFIINNPITASYIGNNAKKICLTHSTNIIFNQWNDYIEELLN